MAVSAVLWVALGGAAGAVSRYGLNNAITRTFGGSFPWGILVVNVLGSLAIGMLTAFFLRKSLGTDVPRLLLATGFLGGFTTFSAFALDIVKLMQSGQNTSAAMYAVASVVLSVLAVFAGLALVRAIT
jgi:fluoride exporter